MAPKTFEVSKSRAISEHQAAGPLIFHVLSGSVAFRAGARVERLSTAGCKQRETVRVGRTELAGRTLA